MLHPGVCSTAHLVLMCAPAVLQDSGDRLMLDIERSRREHWKFGAKLVRGAYMYLEKARADELGYPSPVWDSLEQTHANYNRWGVLPPLFAPSAVVLPSSHAGCSLRCGRLVHLLSGSPCMHAFCRR